MVAHYDVCVCVCVVCSTVIVVDPIHGSTGRFVLSDVVIVRNRILTFRHRAFSIEDRHFATLQRTLFIYLINKYISLSDICLTVHL